MCAGDIVSVIAMMQAGVGARWRGGLSNVQDRGGRQGGHRRTTMAGAVTREAIFHLQGRDVKRRLTETWEEACAWGNRFSSFSTRF